jgi:phosphosulfolactate phosphohydrolase-like enzyme
MTHTHLEVLFSPAEFDALSPERLAHTTCVVFDILRATTSMVTALAHGAEAIQPVADIQEALFARQALPQALLAGERQGVRISAELTGGTEFDLGNSPAEFTSPALAGRILIWTTTNGTRALRSTRGADTNPAGFLSQPHEPPPPHFGRTPQARSSSSEPAPTTRPRSRTPWLRAHSAKMLWELYEWGDVADSALIARTLWRQTTIAHLLDALAQSLNGRRLLKIPALKHDVAFAAQLDPFPIVVDLDADGFARIHP